MEHSAIDTCQILGFKLEGELLHYFENTPDVIMLSNNIKNNEAQNAFIGIRYTPQLHEAWLQFSRIMSHNWQSETIKFLVASLFFGKTDLISSWAEFEDVYEDNGQAKLFMIAYLNKLKLEKLEGVLSEQINFKNLMPLSISYSGRFIY